MIRQIININEEKCIGCGKCAAACHESAIAIINGKARLSAMITVTVLVTACRSVLRAR